MSRYLLDTTALIDFSKGWQPALSRISSFIAAGDDLGVCAINTTEFYSGLPADQLPIWDEFIGSLLYWPITLAAARRAGQDRYFYARRGQSISTAGALIAAVAREQHAIVITNNVRHYPMPDIEFLPLASDSDQS